MPRRRALFLALIGPDIPPRPNQSIFSKNTPMKNRIFLLPALIFIAGAIASPAAESGGRFRLPAICAPAASRVLLLAIDEQAFPFRQTLALFLTKPVVRREPLLAPSASPDAPDNVAVHFNGTVLDENGRFRMWYYAVHAVPPEGGT